MATTMASVENLMHDLVVAEVEDTVWADFRQGFGDGYGAYAQVEDFEMERSDDVGIHLYVHGQTFAENWAVLAAVASRAAIHHASSAFVVSMNVDASGSEVIVYDQNMDFIKSAFYVSRTVMRTLRTTQPM